MANKNPTHKFKKGEVTNPNGRPKLPEDIKQAREINKIEVERVLNRLMEMSDTDLGALLKDKNTPMLEKLLGNIVKQGVTHGDQARANFLLDRKVGKVKESLEVTVFEPVIIEKVDGSEVILGTKKND